MDNLWAEKYRPKKVSQIILPKFLKMTLNQFVTKQDIPHLIITGDCGIGKTSTALCLSRDILGKNYKNFVLELNASNDRGKNAAQNIITPFCQLSMGGKIKFKVIIFDEADNMTVKEQQIINKLMDTYDKTTRFVFTCNSSTNIIETIQSRCKIVLFPKVDDEAIKKRLGEICSYEKLEFEEKAMDKLLLICRGDLRNAINIMQTAKIGYNKLNEENIDIICSLPSGLIIEESVKMAMEGKLTKSIAKIETLFEQGYSTIDIVSSIFNILRVTKNFEEDDKIKLLHTVSESFMNIKKGAQSKLQIWNIFGKIFSMRS